PIPLDENDTLTPGLAVEIIRRRARIRDIEVVAPRSSLAAARGRQAARARPLPLDVAWVLEIESGVAGDAIRTSAGLFEANGEIPVWGLERIDAAEDLGGLIDTTLEGVARQVGFEPPEVASDGVLAAGDMAKYLAASYLQLAGGDALSESGRLLAGVVARNPNSAMAMAAHAYTLLLQAATQSSGGEVVEQARVALLEAQKLAPDLPEVFLYRSLLAHRFDWDWRAAQVAAEAALKRAPGDAAVLSAAATAAFTRGDFERGEGQLRRAVALDPLVLSHRLKYGLMLEFAGRYQAAIDAYRELMEIDPRYPGGHVYLGRSLVVAGMADAALQHMEIEQSLFWRRYGMALVLSALDRADEAEPWLEALVREHGHEAAVQIAEIEAFRGNHDQAFGWLETARAQRDPGLSSLVGNPLFESLRGDDRWRELLQGTGLQES
ncbi:MAG: tetratricopeptide repeat protein, partial [Xanthomonadales bacterium]|nr:tetratricopeptide repeat protein [Xanthomonadales bacterium]